MLHIFSTPAQSSNIQTTLTKSPKPKIPKEKLTFGTTFTDHIMEVNWTAGGGWEAPKIAPYAPFQIDPAASVLHYALECFEGMKAYRDAEGNVRMFRPMKNMNRFHDSCARLQFPSFDKEEFLRCIEELVRVDSDWIPEGDGYSLYLRPTAISTHPFLGVGPSGSVKLYCMLAPVGPYYPEGFKPTTLLAERRYVRAWPGGTGASKLGANYGPTIQPQVQAAAGGFSQVLWIFGNEDGGEVTEAGTMNFMAFLEKEDGSGRELVTPALDGTILPGVTRDSVLTLAKEWGEFEVSERKITMGEVTRAAEAGRLLECFGCGTAAVVSPIKSISSEGNVVKPLHPSGDEGAGPLTQRVWESITGIQYGKVGRPEWSPVISKPE